MVYRPRLSDDEERRLPAGPGRLARFQDPRKDHSTGLFVAAPSGSARGEGRNRGSKETEAVPTGAGGMMVNERRVVVSENNSVWSWKAVGDEINAIVDRLVRERTGNLLYFHPRKLLRPDDA